jgi:hypothetical protein
MSIKVAFQAFMKAFKNPQAGQAFVAEAQETLPGSEASHLRLLALLQNSGRLVDFLKEDIGYFTDAQVGAAVRKIHQDCGKTLEEVVTLRPLMNENEGAKVTVPVGYDARAIKVVGKVKGEPPYHGTLVHKGWKAHKRSLPKQVGEAHLEIICPAEIEIR